MWHQEFKLLLEAYTGLDKDALHIHAALLLYFLALFAFRQTRRSRFPWLFVLAFELVNETLDLWEQSIAGTDLTWWDAWVGGRAEAAKDLWNTMLWPTVLLLIGRYTTLFEHRYRGSSTVAVASGEPLEDTVSLPLGEGGELK